MPTTPMTPTHGPNGNVPSAIVLTCDSLRTLIAAAIAHRDFSTESVTAISALHGAVDAFLDCYEERTSSPPCAWCGESVDHDDEGNELHPVTCPICGDRFCSDECLDGHVDCSHPDQEICPECRLAFFVTSPIVAYCDVCGERFCSPSCRDEHLRRVHNELPPPPAEIPVPFEDSCPDDIEDL